MWEAIRANRRKSLVLFLMMGICLVVLGYLVGYVLFPGATADGEALPGGLSGGGISGVFIALAIWGILSLVSIFSGKHILLSASNAKKVTADVHPQLFNVVDEMRIAANLNKMPEVYIINSEAPNAFATGRNPENSAIAVTAGLLARLNRDELQGVVAHEMSHIINRDIRFMTFAGIMLGSIILLSEVFLRGMFFSSAGRYRSSGKSGGGQGQLIIMILAIVLAILVPIVARLMYFAISRKREYLADASGVRLSRYPEGLASALEKISNSNLDLEAANKVTAPMYIINPLKKKGMKMADLTSTHPPISERIRILRAMQHGVNYSSYQQAYSSVKGGGSIIPKSALANTEEPGIRSAAERKAATKHKSTQRKMGDIMMAVNQYSFIPCSCGVRLKVPPEYKKTTVRCPKCGTVHER